MLMDFGQLLIQTYNTSGMNTEEVSRTDEWPQEMLNEFMLFYKYYIVVLAPLALCGNTAVVISAVLFLRTGKEPRAAYILLGNIALVDSITSLCIIFTLADTSFSREKYLCSAQIGGVTCASLISILSICLIAVERFLYIVQGIMYDAVLTHKRIVFCIIIVWILGLSGGFIPAMIFAYTSKEKYIILCDLISTPVWVIVPAGFFALPAFFFVPFAYAILYFHIRKMSMKLGAMSGLKLRSILVVFLSSLSFIICWGPYVLCLYIYKFWCEPAGDACSTLALSLISPLTCLAFTNSLLNPFIYAWWHPPYQRAIRKVLCPAKSRDLARASLVETWNVQPRD